VFFLKEAEALFVAMEAHMPSVSIEDHDSLAIIRLNNGVTNAISPALVVDLSAAVKQVQGQFIGVVLAGGEKFLSIGFDLPGLLQLDRDGVTEFFYNFNRAALALFTLPLPTACAITGHATAGGTILALTCDYRFAATGKKLMGLNEVKLGVPVPYLADLILRQIVGDRAATEILYLGDLVPTSEAARIGLVDEVLQQDEVEDRALEKVATLAALPRPAFEAIKVNRVEAIRIRYEENYESKHETFLDCWFTEQTQELLIEAAKKF
jgi:enoyl-CoA hydratase/carnithine racemase